MNRARTELCRKTSPTFKRCIHSTNQQYSPKATSGNRIKGSGPSSSSPHPLLVSNNRGTIPKSFGVGMLGGTLGSFVGIGGGVFTIPIMTSSVFGLTQRQAMSTNLVAVMFTGIAGASAYAAASNNNDDVELKASSDAIDSRDETEKGNDALNKLQTLLSTANNTDSNVQIDMAITAAVAGMITARLGARISNRLTEKTLKRFLAGVMYIAAPAVHLPEFMENDDDNGDEVEKSSAVVAVGKENVIASSTLKEQSSSNKDATNVQQQQLLSEEYVMTRLVPAAMIGSGAGVFSGVTGLGGGIITVSAFSLLTPLSYKQALGTSLCAMAFPATSAAIAHHLNGNIVWRVAPCLAAGAACGAFVGGKIGSKLPEKELKYSFSAVMIALGTKVLLRV